MTPSSMPREPTDGDNYVFLRGRLADLPAVKDLPSGDSLVTFRLTVNRPPGERSRVDSLECVSVRAKIRRTVERAAPGDLLEVEGRLHRRFWRSPTGLASRYAVDVEAARLTRAGKPSRSRVTDRSAGA